MPFPADFSNPPKRPPATEPITRPDGNTSPAWVAYFDKLDEWHRRLLAALLNL